MEDCEYASAVQNQPLAYFLTWTTYGSWLHGDARGSVAPGANEVGTPTLRRDDYRREFEVRRLSHAPVRITPAMRATLEKAIVETCDVRGWQLFAVNIRVQHVHAVVSAEGTEPERVLNSFKAWGTRYLRAEGLLPADSRLWTRHGSTRRLWTEDDVAAARSYVLDHQGLSLEGSGFEAPDFG